MKYLMETIATVLRNSKLAIYRIFNIKVIMGQIYRYTTDIQS